MCVKLSITAHLSSSPARYFCFNNWTAGDSHWPFAADASHCWSSRCVQGRRSAVCARVTPLANQPLLAVARRTPRNTGAIVASLPAVIFSTMPITAMTHFAWARKINKQIKHGLFVVSVFFFFSFFLSPISVRLRHVAPRRFNPESHFCWWIRIFCLLQWLWCTQAQCAQWWMDRSQIAKQTMPICNQTSPHMPGLMRSRHNIACRAAQSLGASTECQRNTSDDSWWTGAMSPKA